MYSTTLQMRPEIRLAVQCSAILATSIFVPRLFRAVLSRVFSLDSALAWIGPVSATAIIIGLVWFLLIFLCGTLCARRATAAGSATTFEEVEYRTQQASGLLSGIGIAAMMALVVAISAWLTLLINDEEFYSRLLPWVVPLIRLQEVGFRVAARLFPCRQEGFDTGCEAYKWVPAFLLSNALAYFSVLLPAVVLYRRAERFRSVVRRSRSSILRWGSLLGVFALCLRLLLYRSSPEIASPLSQWGIGRLSWVFVDGTAGCITVLFVLSVPFYGYRVAAAIWKRSHVSDGLVQLTWLMSFLFVALGLGNQFPK